MTIVSEAIEVGSGRVPKPRVVKLRTTLACYVRVTAMPTVRTLSCHRVRYREPRRDKRLHAPVFRVYIDGRVYSTANWSLGGLLLARYRGRLSQEGVVRGVIVDETIDGPDFVRFEARVIRLDRTGPSLALRFTRPDGPLTPFFERSLMRRLAVPAPAR